MKLSTVWLLATLFQSVPLHPEGSPQDSGAASETQAPKFEKLSNGLRLCVIEDHALPLVSVQLWFKVGSSFDPPTQPGLTHLAVCALQQASPGESAQPAAAEYHDAATLRDACYFHSVFNVDGAPRNGAPPGGIPEAVDHALQREASRFAPTAAARATLKTAQAMLPKSGSAGTPTSDPKTFPPPLPAREGSSASSNLLQAMFPNHPYRWPPELVGEWVGRADDAVLREHLERWFAPSHATLFVIGDIAADAAIASFRKHFSAIEWRDAPRRADFDPPPDERPIPSTGRAQSPDNLTVAWLTPPFGSFENVAIDVLMVRLCSGVEGPLSAALPRAGWSAPTWEHKAWRNCGLLTISSRRAAAGSAPSSGDATAARGTSAGEIARLIDGELERAADSAVSVEELNRARALASRAAWLRRVSFVQRAVLLAEHEIIGGDVLLHEYEPLRCAHASAGDVTFAAKLLGATRRIVIEGDSTTTKPAAGQASAADEWHLRELVGDLTLAKSLSGWPARVRQVREIDTRAAIELLAVPGNALVWITINREGATVDRAALQRALEARADYLSYHGLELTAGDSQALLQGSGAADRLDALLELAVGALRESSPRAAGSDRWRIRCVGGVSIDVLEKATRAAME